MDDFLAAQRDPKVQRAVRDALIEGEQLERERTRQR